LCSIHVARKKLSPNLRKILAAWPLQKWLSSSHPTFTVIPGLEVWAEERNKAKKMGSSPYPKRTCFFAKRKAFLYKIQT
jgi:hypothetical protein